MEEYLSYVLVAFLGLILALLARSLTKMYERLWNNANKKPVNPEEQAALLLEVVNEALKLKEDRQRKLKTKQLPISEKEEQPEQTVTPDMESKIEALWQQYKELGGE
ncbi:hypothetical protein ES705_35428 [subsurface metagenome]